VIEVGEEPEAPSIAELQDAAKDALNV